MHPLDSRGTHLDVPYPERLSRGLVLVKSWLLAIPHYVVLAVFIGGGVWLGTRGNGNGYWDTAWGAGRRNHRIDCA